MSHINVTKLFTQKKSNVNLLSAKIGSPLRELNALTIEKAVDKNTFDPDASMEIKQCLGPAVPQKPSTTVVTSDTSSCNHT